MLLLLLACATPEPDPAQNTDSDAVSDTQATAGSGHTGAIPTDAAGFAARVDGARYQAHLEALAGDRSPGTPGWAAARDRCQTTLEDLGYDVRLEAFGSGSGAGTNVVGRKAGAASDGAVIVSAHFDSVRGCAGADDNASGVAGALEVARVLADGDFTHDLVIACWDREEAGLLGSKAWVAENTEPVRLMWSFEMIGYTSDQPNSQTLPIGFGLLFPEATQSVKDNDNRGDFITWVGNDDASAARKPFRQHAAAYDLPVIDLQLTAEQTSNFLFADLKRSDHASFWDAGHPAIMVTDGANFRNLNYHCRQGPDSVARLNQDFAAKTLAATVGASVSVLEPQ